MASLSRDVDNNLYIVTNLDMTTNFCVRLQDEQRIGMESSTTFGS